MGGFVADPKWVVDWYGGSAGRMWVVERMRKNEHLDCFSFSSTASTEARRRFAVAATAGWEGGSSLSVEPGKGTEFGVITCIINTCLLHMPTPKTHIMAYLRLVVRLIILGSITMAFVVPSPTCEYTYTIIHTYKYIYVYLKMGTRRIARTAGVQLNSFKSQ